MQFQFQMHSIKSFFQFVPFIVYHFLLPDDCKEYLSSSCSIIFASNAWTSFQFLLFIQLILSSIFFPVNTFRCFFQSNRFSFFQLLPLGFFLLVSFFHLSYVQLLFLLHLSSSCFFLVAFFW